MRCRFVALAALLLLLTTAILAPSTSAANPQVVPGNSVILTPTTFQAPMAGWAVYGPDGTLVANQGGPGNWTVTDALSSNGQAITSITITVPLGTALGTGYKVVYAGPGSSDTAYFDVVASATPPPAAPMALTATTVSPSQINLTWTAPTGTVTSYNVKRGTATGGPYTTIGSPTTTSYASTGLAAGTRYYYVITAVNAGGESVPSAEISRATQCAAPTGLTATATTTQIGLAWTTTKGATSYNLYRGTSSGAETVYQSGLTSTSYTDTSVTAITTYYYTLTALNSAGESVTSAEVSSATLCAAPTNLGATTVSPSQINLTWTASAGANSYNIKIGTATGGPYTTVGTATTTSYSSTGLASGTRYYYVITAVNAGGESVPSAEISRATQCAAPTGLTATSTATQIGLTWTTTKGATSYSLYRGTSAGGESGTAYQTGLTGTSYTDTAVSVGTAYYYTLKALNSGGASVASAETSATPGVVSLSSVSVSPASVTGGSSATGTVTLSGAAPAGGVVVSLSDNSASVTVPASVTVAAGSSTATFTATTTSVSAPATATVTATYSGVSKTAMLTVNPNLSVVSDLSVYTTGSGKITLYWTRVVNATGYNVYRGTASAGEDYIHPVNGTTPVNTVSYSGSSMDIYSSTGLTNGTEYFYTIKAVYSSGESEASNEDSDVPDAAAVPWDTRNPGAILSAFNAAFASDTSNIGADPFSLRVVGPDNTIYDPSFSTAQLPDGTVTPGTNQLVRPDGTTQALPDDEGQLDPPSQMAFGLSPNAVGTPLQGDKGPFRRVSTRKNANGSGDYRGSTGIFYLPTATVSATALATHGDSPVMYLGISGSSIEVDAGLAYQNGSHSWALEMQVAGKIVSAQGNPANTIQPTPLEDAPTQYQRFAPNSSVIMSYWAWGRYPTTGRAKLSLLLVDDPYSDPDNPIAAALGAPARYLNREENVRVKRVHAIAQTSSQNTAAVFPTGTTVNAASWSQGSVFLPDAAGSSQGWSSADGTLLGEDGYYEGGHSTVNAYRTSRYIQEDSITITIDPN